MNIVYIWHLRRENNMVLNQVCDVVVAATSEKEARQIANENSREEGYIWTDTGIVAARRLGVAEDDIQGIIVQASERA